MAVLFNSINDVSLAGDVKQDPHLLGRDVADRPISEMNKWITGVGLFPLGLPKLGKIGQIPQI